LLVACEHPREVSVRVSIPGLDSVETPASGIEVIALPYNRDSLLKELTLRARTPRPNVAPLDSAFAEFRGPFVAYSAAAYRARTVRDTVALLTRRLDSLPSGASQAEREALRARRDAAADSLKAIEARQERARHALDSARTVFLRRSDSLRSAVHRWEDSTYRGWDSIVSAIAAARRQDPRADTTNATGWTTFTLPGGAWWIYARSWDASDPNAEWYWNIPVTSDTIALSSKTAQHRPRY